MSLPENTKSSITLRDAKLAKECLRALKAHTSSLGPRNRQLIQQIVGMGGTEQGYFYGGFTVSAGIRSAIHAIGKSIYDFNSILDFGCGSARILRWFQDASPNARLCGCDINGEAVDWCTANAGFGEFQANNVMPPLPYADATFDLVYAISVVTHLNREMQLAWLSEIRRVTKPEGVILMTVHGEDKAEKDLAADEMEEFKRHGFFYKSATELPSVEGLPDFYQVAFHSEAYIREVWQQYFDVLCYYRHGCMYAQDLVVLRAKTPAKPAIASVPVHTNLPIAVLENPAVGDPVSGEDFEVSGWTFFPDGGSVTVQIKIDGRTVGHCTARANRPDVSDAFYTTPSARQSGFSLRSSTMRLRKGQHVAWICLVDDPTPLCATFFYCPTALWYRAGSKAIRLIKYKVRIRTRLRKIAARLRQALQRGSSS